MAQQLGEHGKGAKESMGLRLPAARVQLPILDETRRGAFIDKYMNSIEVCYSECVDNEGTARFDIRV